MGDEADALRAEARRIQNLQRARARLGQLDAAQAKETYDKKSLGVGDLFAAAAELPLVLGGGLMNQLHAGGAGLYAGGKQLLKNTFAPSGISENPSPRSAMTEAMKSVTDRAYQPHTEGGQAAMGGLAKVLSGYDQATTALGNTIVDPNPNRRRHFDQAPFPREEAGSPALATALKMSPDVIASMAGVKGPVLANGDPITMQMRRNDINRLNQDKSGSMLLPSLRGGTYEGSQGINFGANPQTMNQQFRVAGGNLSENQGARGERLGDLREALRGKKDEVQYGPGGTVKAPTGGIEATFNEAKASNTGVRSEDLAAFDERLTQRLKADYGSNLPTMTSVENLRGELAEMLSRGDDAITLREIEEWRQRVGRTTPNDGPAIKAHTQMKKAYDDFRQDLFDRDMLSGDPAGVTKWKEATEAWRGFKETFSDDKTIKNLWDKKATPETVKKWIFGTNSLPGGSTEASAVVNKLKDILGEDSTQFQALRQEVLFDLAEPLMGRQPNLQLFVENYDKFTRNSKGLADALFPESLTAIKELRNMAAATNNARSSGINLDIDESISRMVFGHGIAIAALKVSVAANAIRLMRGSTGRTKQGQIMSDLVGYDIGAPLIPVEFAERMSILDTIKDDEKAGVQ